MEVQIFDNSLKQFIKSLDKPTKAKLIHVVELLERFGHQLGLPHSRKISCGLFELRILGIQQVRIFYAFHKGQAILLHGFVKKSSAIPCRELRNARQKLRRLTSV